MSQISNDSNTQFYTPKSSTNQDQFKSAQEKLNTLFEEKSITPKSNTNFNLKDQTPIRNTDFMAQFVLAPQQDPQQQNIQFFGYDDFPQMTETIDNDNQEAGVDSSQEYKQQNDQQQQKIISNRKDLKDLDDLFNTKNTSNAFQSNEQFQKFNTPFQQNTINSEQLPIEKSKETEVHPEKQKNPYLHDFSSAHQKTQQMAFTFHEPNQFYGEETQNNFIEDSLQSQSFVAKPNFEIQENNFYQFQPQQLDNNQNLNFHKTYSTPVQQNIFEQPRPITSQKSLNDDISGSNISSQIRNQISSLPQLNFGQQIYPQSNPNQFMQQQQLPQQIPNYSPIQSLEIIKQQQLDLSSEQENKSQQNVNIINSKLEIKEDEFEFPSQNFDPQQQPHDYFLQDNKMKDQELNLPQEISKAPKVLNQAPIQIWQEFIPQSDPQSSNQIKKLECPQQQQLDKNQNYMYNQQLYEQKQINQQQQLQKFVDSVNLQVEDEEFQPNFPFQKQTFKVNQNQLFTEQPPIAQIQIQNTNSLIQSYQFDSNEDKLNSFQPEQKELYTDWNQKPDNNRIMSHNSYKSFEQSQQSGEDEIFYDIDNASWDQDQGTHIQSQNLNQKQQQNEQQFSSQQLLDQQQELKITPRVEINNEKQSLNDNSQPKVTPNQSPQFLSINNSSKSVNEKKKNNPFEETEVIKDPKWEKELPQFDYQQFEAKPELKKQLEPITEMQEESLTYSQAIQNRNSSQFQENTLIEYQEKSIEESKVIQPSIKVQSQEIPSSFKGFHGVRESKDSNKEAINPQQLVEQLIPGLQDIIKKSFQSNIECQLQQLALQFQQKLQDEELDNFDIDKISSKVFMIENLVQGYGKKLDQITEMLNKEKENQEQQRISEQNVQMYGQDSQQPNQQQQQQQKQICSPFELNLEDNFDEQPISNIQQQNQPYSKVKVAQSNLLYNSHQKGFVPYQTLYQTQSQYLNESRIKQDQIDKIPKYQTNCQFQKQSLKSLHDYEIQNFKKQCLSEQTTLLDTYELIVTLTSEKYEIEDTQEFKIIILLKNKAQYEIQNLIVLFNSNKINDEYIIRSEKVSQQYLNPGDIIRQEITFQYYDLQSYTINNVKIGQNFNKMSQSQGLQGIQDYSNLYLSQINSRYAIQEVGQFKRNFQFCIARPANKFFVYNFITGEEIQEYEMKCQSEQFQLRSLEELVIFHPWLIQIDQFTVGGKVSIQLKNGRNEFVIKVVNKNQKGIVYMNGMDMDSKLTEHFLTFFSFLFSKLY